MTVDGRRLHSTAGRLSLFSNLHDKLPGKGSSVAAANASRAADSANGTLLWSEAQKSSSKCGRSTMLGFMRSQLYAYSFIPGKDALLLAHWLQHYISGIGIPPAHFAFGMMASSQANARIWDEHRAVLEHAGIDVRRQITLLNSTYTDELRLANVNNYIAALPKDAWLIFADHDEFFRFSCTVRQAVQLHRGDVFCSPMLDMLALDGTIAPLQAAPDISVQYPIACRIRDALSNPYNPSLRFMTEKVALFKVWSVAADHNGTGRPSTQARHFRTPHRLHGEPACRHGFAWLAHYTLTAEAMKDVEAKAARHEVEAQAWIERATAARLLNASMTMDEALGATERSSFISCAMRGLVRNKLGSPCLDYKLIGDFMKAQQRNPSRDVFPLCDLRLPSRYAPSSR